MSAAVLEQELVLGPESAGLLMTPEEFDAVQEYDENYRYELIHGVLVVSPVPLPQETGPNELLGYYLLYYKQNHPQGWALSDTLPQQYVRTRTSRRLADRLIWTGLGKRAANVNVDLASVAVEFVSAGRRNRTRDYVDKRQEYSEIGIQEYWIVDRFERTLTVIRKSPSGERVLIIKENETYRTPLLPGFELPVAPLLQAADRYAGASIKARTNPRRRRR